MYDNLKNLKLSYLNQFQWIIVTGTLICVSIIWLSFMHHIITIQHKPYNINHLYLYKHVFNYMGIFQKERKNLNI